MHPGAHADGWPRMIVATKRVLANVALSYAAAGIVTLAFMGVANLVAPSTFESVPVSWFGFLIFLSYGSPAVLIALAIVDVVLTASTSQRRDGFALALLPGALAALLLVPHPEMAPLVAWLVAEGVLFGWIMRLPKRARVLEPTR